MNGDMMDSPRAELISETQKGASWVLVKHALGLFAGMPIFFSYSDERICGAEIENIMTATSALGSGWHVKLKMGLPRDLPYGALIFLERRGNELTKV